LANCYLQEESGDTVVFGIATRYGPYWVSENNSLELLHPSKIYKVSSIFEPLKNEGYFSVRIEEIVELMSDIVRNGTK
jgi:hypothetical protein